MRLTIRYARAEQRILESVGRPSVRALQDAAVAYVRAHGLPFGLNATDVRELDLRATVRRAAFGPGEAYDMSAYRGDDLTRLFGVRGAGGVPRFEVEVERER